MQEATELNQKKNIKAINNMKTLIDELVILDDCVVTGTFKWRSDIDPEWTPRVWNETFECWTKDYAGILLNDKETLIRKHYKRNKGYDI